MTVFILTEGEAHDYETVLDDGHWTLEEAVAEAERMVAEWQEDIDQRFYSQHPSQRKYSSPDQWTRISETEWKQGPQFLDIKPITLPDPRP